MVERTREFYVEALEESESPEVREFARYLGEKSQDGSRPCWGGAAAHALKTFESGRTRIALWKELLRTQEENALLLFIKLYVDNLEVMEAVLSDAGKLPITVQRALVSIDEIGNKLDQHLPKFSQKARDFRSASAEDKRRERASFDTRTSGLLFVKMLSPKALKEDEPERQ